MLSLRFNARLAAVLLAATSAGLSVFIISFTKILLVITALVVLLRNKHLVVKNTSLQQMWTPRLVVVISFIFGFSLLWTTVPLDQGLGALGKYGKFLVIPAFLILIRTRQEASWAVLAFLLGQAFLLCSSWLLYLHLPLVWATSRMAIDSYSVFSSYLDQGIMSATVAAIFWHLKTLAPNRFLYCVAIVMSLLALGLVFVVFIGRTGFVVGAAMISLAVFWALPRRYRLASLIVPPTLLVLAMFSFDKVAQRFSFTKTEISAFSSGVGAANSADNRLDFWKGSLSVIAKNPLFGTGVGSWATEYNRVMEIKFPGHKDLGIGGNPHQEYLLWGVQLGLGGIVMLFAFFSAAVFDFLKLDRPLARAGLSVLASLTIACFFNSSLYDAYIGDFFCLSLGVLLAFGKFCQDKHRLNDT
jgi:O-antigen ligase